LVASVSSVQDGLCGASGEIRFWRCADERTEALAVALHIERLIFREAIAPRQIAVLLRAGQAGARELTGALQERAIPYRPYGVDGMLARTEVRDALAWMRLLVAPNDAGAAVRVLIRPPVEMRHVDLAQVVQIARRRGLDVVSALPAATESPQVPPEARERIHRFLELHADLAPALANMPPGLFLDHLLKRIDAAGGGPLTDSSQVAERGASVAWLQGQARSFSRRFPSAGGRELVSHLVAIADTGAADELHAADAGAADELHAADAGAADELHAAEHDSIAEELADPDLGRQEEGLVQLLDIVDVKRLGEVRWAYLMGLCAERIDVGLCAEQIDGQGRGAAESALSRLAESGCEGVVLSYPAHVEDRECAPEPAVERVRDAIGARWEEMASRQSDPDETIEAALRAMRQELLDGVASIGGRLRELRLDTDVDVSHGIVRYLELVKLAALLERPPGQSIAETLADVNARLLPAVTPLQREILESSTLDEELMAGRGLALAGSALSRVEAGEPSLQRFLPRRGDGLLLSASDIETYRSCPLRYKFARVLRIPSPATRSQRFGIALHQVLERYHASGADTLAQLLTLLDECWRRAGFGAGAQEEALREKATSALRRYHARLADQRSEPVWFERMFAFRLGRHHVRGRVDRVDRLPDGSYELIDYKTGRPKGEQQLRQDVQLSLYAIAAQECWQLQTSAQSYYYLLDDVKIPLPGSGEDADRVRETAIDIAEAILSERFEPTPSPSVCGMCDHRIVCPAAQR
jgi:DNA helicase-2/ATP-dependent DNA helicase PcrA